MTQTETRETFERLGTHVARAICRNDTPEDLLKEALDQLEREILYELLDANSNNRSLVAHILGWHRNTLRTEMARLNVVVGPVIRKAA